MKYLKQFALILLISFIGEALNSIISLPIPGSIYGLLIMFFCLKLNILSVGDVKETSNFLIEIMPLLFIPAAVGMMSTWHVLKPVLLPFGVIIVVSTFVVMTTSGAITQWIIRKKIKEA